MDSFSNYACTSCSSWYCCHPTLLAFQNYVDHVPLQISRTATHNQEPEVPNFTNNSRGNRVVNTGLHGVGSVLNGMKQDTSLMEIPIIPNIFEGEDHNDFLNSTAEDESIGFGQLEQTPTPLGQSQQGLRRSYVEASLPLGSLQMPISLPHSEFQYRSFQHNRFGENTDPKYPLALAEVSWDLRSLEDDSENQDIMVVSDNIRPMDMPRIKKEVMPTEEITTIDNEDGDFRGDPMMGVGESEPPLLIRMDLQDGNGVTGSGLQDDTAERMDTQVSTIEAKSGNDVAEINLDDNTTAVTLNLEDNSTGMNLNLEVDSTGMNLEIDATGLEVGSTIEIELQDDPSELEEQEEASEMEQSNCSTPRYNYRNRSSLHICPTCGKKFPQLATLKLHENVHKLADLKPFHCNLCKRNYTSKVSYDRHLKRHRNCVRCQEQMPNAPISNLEEHEMDVTCDKCKSHYGLAGGEVPKLRVQTVAVQANVRRPFNEFETVEQLDDDEYDSQLDTDPEDGLTRDDTSYKYQCHQCDKQFVYEARYKYHLKCHIRKDTNPFQCPQCGEQFGAMNGLRNHEVKHMANTNYECDLCNMKFRMAHHLKHHYSTHFKSSDFKCPSCGKEFGSLCSLRTHEKKSTYCSKGFKKSQRGGKKK